MRSQLSSAIKLFKHRDCFSRFKLMLSKGSQCICVDGFDSRRHAHARVDIVMTISFTKVLGCSGPFPVIDRLVTRPDRASLKTTRVHNYCIISICDLSR